MPPLSSRQMAGLDSNSSSTGSANSGQKRRLASVRHDNSLSGYSADREESSISPPMISIDLGGEQRHHSVREMNSCPKRQKKNELQFSAASVRADLARGGFEYSTVSPEIEKTTTLGSVSINLKDIKLVHSADFDKKTIMATSGLIGSTYDYQALALACWESYPMRSKLSTKVDPSPQDDSESTSSVSESDMDSVSSKNNPGASIDIPPLFKEDVLETNVAIPTGSGSCSVVSSANSTMTMSKSLALTTTPRLLALSCHPFSIVHANAAFLRLSGLPCEKIIGSGFASIVDSSNDEEGSKPVLLSDCLVSSDSGNPRKLQLVREDETMKPVERWAKVFPIVERKPSRGSEVSNVTHFAVELVEEMDLTNEVISMGSSSSDTMSNIKRSSPVHGGDLAVGVMG